jgi:hypothetical protein
MKKNKPLAKGKTLNVSLKFWEKVQRQKLKHRKRKAEDVLQVIDDPVGHPDVLDDNNGEATREKDETLDNTFNSP